MLLPDSPHCSRRGLWAAKLALGYAGPATSQRCYFHLDDVVAHVALTPTFQHQAVNLSRTEVAYVTGVAVQKLPQGMGGARQRLGMSRILRMRSDHFGNSTSRVAKRGRAQLPPRPDAPVSVLTLLQADQALGFSYRRGAIDGAHRTLLVPAEQLQALFAAEIAARETAGYDLPGALWPQTQASTAVRHARVGARSISESARVVPFLKHIQPMLRSPEFARLSQDAIDIWQRRYRSDCTPLVVESVQEVTALVMWCLHAGIDPSALMVRLPADESADEPAEDLAILSAALSQATRGREIAIEPGKLPLVRSRFKRRNRQRYGFLLRENDSAALTQMSQLHRVMHVVSALVAKG